MGTTKSIAFAAPYTSQTFNDAQAINIGTNGVMTGMSVTTSGSVATIQPGSFVQNGLVVTVTQPISATVPATLVAPYSIVVTTSSSVENLGEIITPTFAQRPEDLSANSVVVADWDGNEWVQRAYLQVAQVVADIATHAVDQGHVGIASGFGTTALAGVVSVEAGSLIDQQGAFVTKALGTSFTAKASDSDGLLRVDEILYRRPDDDANRPGSIQYAVGPTYNSAGSVQILHNTQVGINANTNVAYKAINVPSSNTSLFFYLSNTDLKLVTSPDPMTSFTGSVVIATGVSSFDATLNPSGNVDIIYTSGNNVYYQQVTTTGVTVYASTPIAAHAFPTSNPQVVTVNSGASFFIHTVYEVAVSGAVHQLWYVRLSSANTIETAQQLLVDLSAVVTNPSLDKDDTDALILLAYENSTTGKVYLREYDASTATALAAPTQRGATVELESDTVVLSTSTTLSANGSTRPKVRRAANKETYVFWLQDKGASTYGIAVYNRRNTATFGHLAYIQDLVTLGENIALFDVALDGVGNAHFSLSEGSSLHKASLVLESGDVLGTTTAIDANTPSGISVNFNATGSLVHFWSYVSGPNTSINFAKTTAGAFTNLRGYSATHADVVLAHYRTPDGVVASAGLASEEAQAVSRLYEFMNCAGATGQVSWGVTASNQLAFSSAITLNFLNRASTYSIAAIPGGVTIANGYMAYVQIPDDDNAATLSLQTVAFGAGVLDRFSRNTFVLFWNVGGVLYSRFAPFRLTTGEIINLGDQVSVELQNWLGMPSTVPTTHSYNTTQTVISNTDSHEAAIGKLDARGDVNIPVTLIDLVTTTLPTGASATIDGVAVANGNRVLFTQLNEIYVVSGVGTSLVWTAAAVFNSSTTPFAGAVVSVQQGTSYAATLWHNASEGWKPLEISDASLAPTGFVNRTDSTIAFTDGSRTFTIAPASDHFDFYIQGKMFRKDSAQTVVLPNSDGLYLIYFDNTGTLQYTTTYTTSLLNANAFVADVLWSVSDAKGVLLGDERHGVTMDWQNHQYLHLTQGFKLQSGFTVTYTLGTDGSTDAQAEIALSNGTCWDEDVAITATNSASPSAQYEQTLTPIAKIPVFYLDSTGVWRKTTAGNFPVKTGASRIQYNLFSGGNWSTVDASEGYFVPMFVFATNNALEPVIAILGQSQYSTLAAAQVGALYSSLTFGSLLTPEMKTLYRVIYQTSSTFTNTTHAMVAEVVDLRVIADSTVSATSVTEHNLLSGRDAPSAHPATAVSTTTTSFTRVLGASDTNSQQCFNDIDDQINKFFGQLLLTPATAPARAKISGAEVTMQDGAIRSQALNNLIMSFTGAQIDFSTGNVYASDGATPLGIDFTPFSIPSGSYFWYAVNVIASTTNTDNTINAQISVSPASAAGTTHDTAAPTDAPLAAFSTTGIPIGQVLVRNVGGVISVIEVRQMGIGSGAGSTSAQAASFPADGYQFLVSDTFDVSPTSSSTYVDSTNTTAAYNAVGQLYQMSCDKTKTITTVGTSFTLSGAPSFTIAPGCIIWVNSLSTWRKIASISSQTNGTLDAAFPSNVTTAVGMVSQAVWTKDLTAVGDSTHHQRGIDIFTNTTVNQIFLDYSDSQSSGDTSFDPVVNAFTVVAGANYGAAGAVGTPTADQFTSIFTRPDAPATWNSYALSTPIPADSLQASSGSMAGTIQRSLGPTGSGSFSWQFAAVFTVASAYSVGSVALHLVKSGSPSGNVYVQIQTDSSGSPSGTVVDQSSNIPLSSITSGTYTFTGFSRAQLSPGTYHIVFQGDASYGSSFVSGSVFVSWNTDGPQASNPGDANFFTSPGPWGSYSNQKFDFQLFGANQNPTQQRCFLTFFPNPNNGSVTTQSNILDYNCSLYPQTTLNNGGYLMSAFCMTDSTGTPNNCSNPTVVSGKTRVNLTASYVVGLNPGMVNGDVSVKLEGLELPRFYTGIVGQYFKEIDPYTIELSQDFSTYSYSVQVERRQGSVDTSSTNTKLLNTLMDAVVGSAADVTAGYAQYSSLQSAVNAVSAYGRILIRPNTTIVENVTISNSINILGHGISSVLSGNITLASGSDFSIVKWFKVTGSITLQSNSNFFTEMWQSMGSAYSDTGSGNEVLIKTV